jgi:hypothetical protein
MQNDPHVVALHYRLDHDETVNFSKAVPLEYETNDFKVRVENKKAVFTMKTHYGDVAAARAVVEKLTRAWKIQTHLVDGHLIEFVFDHPDIINRADKLGDVTVYVQAGSYTITGGTPTVIVGRISYPPPPPTFTASEDVEAMHARYLRYRAGNEPLPSMAYWCLTRVEDSAGNNPGKRKDAATKYHVDLDVLKCLGELVSEKGGSEARKARGASTPYTAAERGWIDAAVKLLIRRLGEVAHDPSAAHRQITMADLPALP